VDEFVSGELAEGMVDAAVQIRKSAENVFFLQTWRDRLRHEGSLVNRRSTDSAIVSWEGESKALCRGLTLIRCGGHFDGGTVLHWAGGADGRGALLSGDIIQVVAGRKHVSFMYSYPNHIPLSASAIERIIKAVEPFEYDRIYGAFWDMVIEKDGKEVVKKSAERYLRARRTGRTPCSIATLPTSTRQEPIATPMPMR
jgi:hypothetical protein